MNSNTAVAGNFNTVLSTMDRTSRQQQHTHAPGQNMLGRNINLNKFRKKEIISRIFPDHSGVLMRVFRYHQAILQASADTDWVSYQIRYHR